MAVEELRHNRHRQRFEAWLDGELVGEATYRLTDDVAAFDHTFVEPDLVIYPRGLELGAVRGPDIVLAVEVSQSSLAYDRGLKAQLYARHGVRELWVVDAQQRVTWIHRDPAGSRWTSITQVAPDAPLRLAELDGFEVRLANSE